ncbi:PREDICTED: multidrug resistance protein 1-like [Acropora digitifera]|uniref:multidrug resistance protein 1-like n=1 Tax=Acropora digitifera TaxID=70779 RepID=UPI00077A5A2B|nr:PREDICTED: multidrug resistance protein 1-like [Acropora digitifera]
MANAQDGVVGSYRPKSDMSTHPYGEPPPYPGIASADHEVRIAPAKDEILRNGETAENGIDPTDTDKSDDKEKKKDKKEKEEKPPMIPLFQLFRFSDRLDVLFMVVGSISAIAHGAAIPIQFVIFGDLINSFINFEKFQTGNVTEPFDLNSEMTKFALYYVYLAIGNLIVAYGQMTLWSLTAARQVKRMRMLFFGSVLKQDIGWFDTTDPGELNSRLSEDLNKVHDGMGTKIGMFFANITTVIVGFVMGFVYGWKLTLVIIAVSPLIVIAGGIIGKLLSSATTQELNAYAKAGSIAEEVISAIRTVAAFGGEKKEIERYASHLGEARDFGIKKGVMSGLGMAFFQLIMFGSYSLAFWYGAKLIIDNEMNGGDLLIVFFSVLVGAMQLGQAGPNFTDVATARGAAYKVFQIIDRVPPIDSSSTDGIVLDDKSFKGDVAFENIEFVYPSRPDIKILNGLSLTVKSGQTVALVGESGCGKSTVVKLLQRFYDPSNGLVTVDGYDIRSLNLRWLRQHIGIVSQEPVLFDTTIAENIRYGKDGVTQDQIESACKMANAHDFIAKLPQGYNTLVGERGTQLSGGQKQRIAIARALVKDPRILLLDEATSALDTESESIVQAALDKAREGRTTIVIAHRLSTVRTADVIAAIQEGVVVEEGSHDDLMGTDGVYHQLVTLQTFEKEEPGVDVDDKEDDDDDEEAGVVEKKESMAAANFMRSMSHMSSDSEHEETEFERKLSARASRRLSAKKRPGSAFDRQNSSNVEVTKDKDGKEKVIEEEVEPAPFLRTLKLNKPELPYLVSGSIAATINGLFPFAFAMVLSEILSVFSLNDNEKMKKESEFWSLMFLAIGAASFLAQLMQVHQFKELLTARLRRMAFAAMLKQEMAYFDDPLHSTGALTTALSTHASAVQGATGMRLGQIAMSLSTTVACLVYAFINGWKLTLVVLAIIPFLIIAAAIQMKFFAGGGGAGIGDDALVQSGKIAVETIGNIRTVVSLGKEDTFYEKYVEALHGPTKRAMNKAHLQGISFGLSEAFMFFANAIAFRYGGYLVMEGEMDLGEVMKVVLSILMGGFTLGQVSALAPDYEKAKVAAARLFKIFDRKSLIDSSSENGLRPSSVTGSIQLRSVRFRYPTRQNIKVLRGLTLSVQKGQKLALVGGSGCGKSTVVSLLERFYDIEDGEVAIDGNNVRTLNLQWLRSHIGIVSQEPILFGCSIAENIAYGDNSREVPMHEIEAAAKAANIHSFINSLPKGYQTLVGDKGTLISGGQKQRIAIARALVRNPQILLLDEATSALDTESEKVVQQALDAASEGRTAIIIAHRLSTVQNADIIAVIHHGRVAEQGTHQELLALKGVYYGLVMGQMQSS